MLDIRDWLPNERAVLVGFDKNGMIKYGEITGLQVNTDGVVYVQCKDGENWATGNFCMPATLAPGKNPKYQEACFVQRHEKADKLFQELRKLAPKKLPAVK
jgi:hypothetical protein